MMLVSACLIGTNCCFDSGNNLDKNVWELVEQGKAIPVCPEQLGGLQTPRSPAEIIADKVMTKTGVDVTAQFKKGALETLKIAELFKCRKAVFKANSPSCGCGKIYDGSFSGNLISGKGITVKLLEKNGIAVISENDLK